MPALREGRATVRIAVVGRAVYGARNAFAYVFSAIDKVFGSKVKLLVVEDDPTSTISELQAKGYRVMVLYGVSSPVLLDLAEEMARVSRRAFVAAGGPHAAGAFWQLLRLGVHAAVVSDGEPAVVGLVEHVAGERDLSEVPNIAFREDGRFRITRLVPADLGFYGACHPGLGLLPPIEIMRGCFYACRFCQTPYMFKMKPRFRPLHSVLEAVKAHITAGRRIIRFVAPIGLAYGSPRPGEPNPEALEQLLAGVRRLGGVPYLGTFPSEAHPAYITPETLRILRRYAGNRRIAIGLQVASNRLLGEVMRGHTVEEALEAIELSLKHQLQPTVDIIMGLPGEREEDVEATCKLMESLSPRGVRFRLHTFMPLPGTPLAHAKPARIHPRYHKTIRKLIGRGVLEGDWEIQEKLSRLLHCIMALDPKPTPEPVPRQESARLCHDVWAKLAPLLGVTS